MITKLDHKKIDFTPKISNELIRFAIAVDDSELFEIHVYQTKTVMKMHIKDIPLLIQELDRIVKERLQL